MDYEKAYKEAFDEATIAYKDEYKHLKATLERIFPVLKESKDKKIREAILNGLIDCRDAPDLGWSNFGGIHIDDCIAWIEKQESVEEIVERCKTSWFNAGKIQGIMEGLSDQEKYQQGWYDAIVYSPLLMRKVKGNVHLFK